ncbi:F-box domain protein [Talaromyces proteolyticus]|uniref:F-box domain protein n=1 Tax=Talaromyces proteolyticus TaxID=1131652 RepID=A0AAD4KRL4_9EURO|nr:F-box domain protein [Talaromyces proteolyticus]KAH8694982.1 F-box domain protein [Talaromyces proteolyticus]
MFPFFSTRKTAENRHHSRDRGRKFSSGLRKTKAHLDPASLPPVLSPSPLATLPTEIQVVIFIHCSIYDLLPLKLVCRSFNEILTCHESSIARQYLQLRRHGTLPSTVIGERIYTRNPEDDVVLLSDLFLPTKSANGGYLYTFRYLHSLRRTQNTCTQLSHYLANRVMTKFFTDNQTTIKASVPSKTERNLLFERGIAHLRFNLVPLAICAHYFLESYASARKEQVNSLLRQYEAGELPVPMDWVSRVRILEGLQSKILCSPPFTDTSTLLATHHFMCLLVLYLRRSAESDQFDTNDGWIAGLLATSGFGRIVEFFSADIGDGRNSRAERREFMANFDRDISAREEINSLVYAEVPGGMRHFYFTNEVWFGTADKEMTSRNVKPHDPERFSIWNEIPVLIWCRECNVVQGWLA